MNPLDNQNIFYGTAAHPNKEAALLKAFLEAIQSRLTVISGAREDILESDYIFNENLKKEPHESINYQDISSSNELAARSNLQTITHRVRKNSKDILLYKYLDSDISIVKTKLIHKELTP